MTPNRYNSSRIHEIVILRWSSNSKSIKDITPSTRINEIMGLFDGTVLERPVICDRCNINVKDCRCPPLDSPPASQTLKWHVEKRKRGKIVTVIQGFDCSATQIQQVLKTLQGQCGAGGSSDDTSVEIQGDHTNRITDILKSLGYNVARKNS